MLYKAITQLDESDPESTKKAKYYAGFALYQSAKLKAILKDEHEEMALFKHPTWEYSGEPTVVQETVDSMVKKITDKYHQRSVIYRKLLNNISSNEQKVTVNPTKQVSVIRKKKRLSLKS